MALGEISPGRGERFHRRAAVVPIPARVRRKPTGNLLSPAFAQMCGGSGGI